MKSILGMVVLCLGLMTSLFAQESHHESTTTETQHVVHKVEGGHNEAAIHLLPISPGLSFQHEFGRSHLNLRAQLQWEAEHHDKTVDSHHHEHKAGWSYPLHAEMGVLAGVVGQEHSHLKFSSGVMAGLHQAADEMTHELHPEYGVFDRWILNYHFGKSHFSLAAEFSFFEYEVHPHTELKTNLIVLPTLEYAFALHR